MTIEEYKKAVVKKLGMLNDCREVEQLISRLIERMKEKHLYASVIADYLRKLKDSLRTLSPSGFNYIRWCNIRCAILYFKKLTNK